MGLKHPAVLSRADFDEAVVKLRANVSEIAKETGIPRTYLSEFRNGDRMLRPEHLAKLRDYFEGKGLEFADADPVPDRESPSAPHPRLKAVEGVRCYFPIADTVSDDVIARAMDAMEENDARLVTLLKQQVARDDGLLGSGDFTDETKAALQELFSLLAENYVVFRMLRGWRAFGVKPASEDPATLRDVLFDTFRPRLVDAGLIAATPATPATPEDDPNPDSDDEEVAA